MSRNFLAFPIAQYIGTPFSVPNNMCVVKGKAVALFIDWLSYGASSVINKVGVSVNLAIGQTPTKLLERISSVYIDNTNSNVPVYVFFPDTRFTAVAAPNCVGWYPVFTNGFECFILGDGFVTGQIPSCTVFLSDQFIPPYSDVELPQAIQLNKASPTITNGSTIFNQDYAVPALGDQIANATIGFLVPSSVVMLPAVAVGWFYFITGINFSMYNVFSTSGVNQTMSIRDSAGATRFSKTFFATNVNIPYQELLTLTGMQLKWDASLAFSLFGPNINFAAGAGECILNYSLSRIP